MQRLGAVENHEQLPSVRSPRTLEIGQQALTQRRVLRRPFPEAEREVSGHPQRSRAPPRDSVHRCAHHRQAERPGQERPAARIATRAAAPSSSQRTAGSRCSCSCPGSRHPPAPAPGSAHTGASTRPRASARRRGDSTDPHPRGPGTSGAQPRAPRRARAAAARPSSAPRDDLTLDRAGPRGRARGLMRIARTAERRPILFQHRRDHAEARAHHQLNELRSSYRPRVPRAAGIQRRAISTTRDGLAVRDFFMAAPLL